MEAAAEDLHREMLFGDGEIAGFESRAGEPWTGVTQTGRATAPRVCSPGNMNKVTSMMKHVSLAIATAAAVTMLAMTGCAKKASQETPVPPPSVTTLPAKQAPPVLPPSPSATTAAASASAAATNQASGEDLTPEQLAAQVKQLENEYQNTPDFQKRVGIIYELSANDDAADVVDTVARLFMSEKDQELKIELINSLTDIDGQNDKKLAILSTAMRSNQPKEVRLEAISGMGDTEDKRGIQVLQGFANDSDKDIKEAVQDSIEQLQNTSEPSAQSMQFHITGQPGQ